MPVLVTRCTGGSPFCSVLTYAWTCSHRFAIDLCTPSHDHHVVPSTSGNPGDVDTKTWERSINKSMACISGFTTPKLHNKLQPETRMVSVCCMNNRHFSRQSALSRRHKLSSNPHSTAQHQAVRWSPLWGDSPWDTVPCALGSASRHSSE